MEGKAKIVTFGETMIRLSPQGFNRLEQTTILEVNVGGSELNVAVTAERLGLDAAYVTRLTRNPLGRMIVNKAREHGVDTSHIIWTDHDRVGVYYVEFGASPRPNKVVYDRVGSAIASIRPGEIDWSKALKSAEIFHTSGITPALSPSAAEATKEAIRAAKQAGLIVSVDLNYRKLLWTPEEARKVMAGIVADADVLITTEEDTERVFGIKEESFETVAEKLANSFELSAVAITLRKTPSVLRNEWTAIAYASGEIYRAPRFEIEIVDRVGSGDCFAGGFLTGYLSDGPQLGVEYGAAASALKQTSGGDLCWVTLAEVQALLAGGSLRIQR